VAQRIVFNGPHMDMTAAETTIILTQLVPGWVSLITAVLVGDMGSSLAVTGNALRLARIERRS
jgi:cation transport ATPase